MFNIPDNLPDNTSLLGLYALPVYLLPDSSYTITRSVVIPPHVFGTFYIFTKTDEVNMFYEGIYESNNVNSNLINVFLTPPPDLKVTNISLPATASTTEPLNCGWSVINQGFTATDAGIWHDSLFLTTNGIFIFYNTSQKASGGFLWRFHYAGGCAANRLYHKT